MKKLLFIGSFFSCCMYGSSSDKQAMQVNVNIGFGHTVPEAPSQPNKGKVITAVGVGAATGSALFLSTALSKNYDAFNNPFVYVFLASVLLYYQREMVKNYLGTAYTSVAGWTSAMSLVASGAVSELYLRAKKLAGYPKTEGESKP